MKMTMKRWTAILLVLILAASLFVGCAGSSGSSGKDKDKEEEKFSLPGTWHVKTIDGKAPYDYYMDEFKETFDADDDEVKELLEYLGIDEDDLKDPMELVIDKDGTYKLKSNVGGEVEKGTWKQDGKTVTFKADDADDDDENTELTIKGGKLFGLSTDEEETEFVFVKSK